MTEDSKNQIGTALYFISAVVMLVGATLTAYHGLPFEESGPPLIMIGATLGLAGAQLKWNGQQCPQRADGS